MSEPRKPRNIVRFREREVARVTKAVREAGGGTVTLNPVTGNYTIMVPGEGGVRADNIPGNDLDNWIANRDAHQT
jgi:lipoate-protein ligase A